MSFRASAEPEAAPAPSAAPDPAAPVRAILRKIARHNPDVLGCIVTWRDAIYYDLPEPYDMMDVVAAAEYARNVFALTEALETGEAPFEEAFLEFEGHSLLAQALDDGVLLLVTQPVKRGVFRKMQLGVGLFLRPLRRALAEAAGHGASAARRPRPAERLRRVFAGLV